MKGKRKERKKGEKKEERKAEIEGWHEEKNLDAKGVDT